MKSICIPCSGPVDTEALLPVIDHPLFQRLRHCRQLGLNELVFPGAQHTRFEHAVGVLARVRKSAGFAQADESGRRNLEIFALLHDIGHGPYSHQIEPVLRQNHHQHGLKCLQEMSEAIARCGADPAAVAAMLEEKDAAAAWVTDRNLGADKLDYLQRDAFHLGLSGVPDLDLLQRQTVRTADGFIALQEKFIEDGKRVQKFYSYLHQHGYLNKTALIAQRILQRSVYEEVISGSLEEEAVWQDTDEQLAERLAHSRLPLVRELLRRLRERRLYRSALCIKPEGYLYVENTAGKAIALSQWPRRRLAQFSKAVQSLDRLKELEDALAALLGLAPGKVLLAAMPYFKKLLPRDLRIANGANGDFWLFDQDRDHRASLESDYLRTFAIRIAVPEERREAAVAARDRLEEALATLADGEK